MDKAFIIAAFSGAIVNLIINFILIPIYGAKGAVIATIITELIVTVIHILFSYKTIHFSVIVKDSIPFFVPAFVMMISVRLIGNYFEESVFTIVIQVLCGAIFYIVSICVILTMQKDKYFINGFKATPHNPRLTPLHVICLHFFRHSTQILLDVA